MKRRFPSSDEEDGSEGAPEEVYRGGLPPSDDDAEEGSSSDEDRPGPQQQPQQQRRQQPASSDDDSQGGGGASASDDDNDSDDDEDSDEQELELQEQALEARLAEVPLGVLAQLQQDGSGPTGAAARAAAAAAKQRVFHRENKNRPQEVSSKRPVSRFRDVMQAPKHAGKDPRFDSTIGGKPFEQDAFARRYSFLYDDVLPQERSALKKQLKKEQREGKRRELQSQLTRLQQALTDERTRRKSKELEKGWKAAEKEAVAGGKKPFFLKKSEVRKRELLAKYEELKSSGRLDKFMAKRRKKNAAKDHRYVPSTRRDGA